MNVDVLNAFFSHFCGQSPHRCFWLGGEVLPVCQRCLGVYCGLLLGALAVPGGGRRESVIPGRLGRAVIGGAIAAMVVMGLHLIDPGPMARFLGGCAFGAALSWLGLPVAKAWVAGYPTRPATHRETAAFALIVCAGSAVLALTLQIDARLPYWVLSTAAALGWLIGFGLLAALVLPYGMKAVRAFLRKSPRVIASDRRDRRDQRKRSNRVSSPPKVGGDGLAIRRTANPTFSCFSEWRQAP